MARLDGNSRAPPPDVLRAAAEWPRQLKADAKTYAPSRTNHRMLFDDRIVPAIREATETATMAPLRKAITAALADPEGKRART